MTDAQALAFLDDIDERIYNLEGHRGRLVLTAWELVIFGMALEQLAMAGVWEDGLWIDGRGQDQENGISWHGAVLVTA